MDHNRFRGRYGPWAIVAGASEGIGRAFCEEIAARGVNLVLIARRAELLQSLADDLKTKYSIYTKAVPLDLANPNVAEQINRQTRDLDIGLLVYNACYSAIGEFLEMSVESKLQTIDVNCRGPVLLCSCIGQRLATQKRGGIILVSSMSGFQGTAMVSTYAATKAFDTVLGESLWYELKPHGVDVLVCAAGATLTPNFKEQTPENKRAQAFPMEPQQVAAEALAAIDKGPLLIPGKMNRAVHAGVRRFLSRRNATNLFSKSTTKMYKNPTD
jgi:short-subunit dehydrogenase